MLKRILVIYFKVGRARDRKTIDEHLFSFRRYVDDVAFHYFNAANGIPWYLTLADYDGVILHYTFLAARWSSEFFGRWIRTITRLKDIKGYKVAIPQDEYAETASLWGLFRNNGVKGVFTMADKEDWHKVYPKSEVSLEQLVTVYAGYVDELAGHKMERFRLDYEDRPVHVGYRARKLPYWIGRHAQQKYEIAEVFREPLRKAGLSIDISTNDRDVFLGDDWYRFLGRCKVMLGSETGSSLLDPRGEIRARVEAYVRERPEASFDEVEEACFPGEDFNVRMFGLSPRHFECAIMKTCQALMEGEYGGILKPNVHYIEIKKDFRNIADVIERLKDDQYCREIAENAYRDIALSGKYTYREFAAEVVRHILKRSDRRQAPCGRSQALFMKCLTAYLGLREACDPLLAKVFYVWLGIKIYKFGALAKLLKRLGRRG